MDTLHPEGFMVGSQVSEVLSPHDQMKDGDLARYLSVGADALRCIRAVAPTLAPRTILDMPCGHGRVARHLAAAFPWADLFWSDLNSDGAAFCEGLFGGTVVPTSEDFDELHLGRKFDLIFVGSLITHFPAEKTNAFLRFLSRHLTSHGRAVVSAHGAFCAGRVSEAKHSHRDFYGVGYEGAQIMLGAYHETGYGFATYSADRGYGISLIQQAWLERAAREAGLRTEACLHHAWDRHHDVYAFSVAS